MKYWRGYLVAAIFAAVTWALKQFAASHSVLVDMIYPYVTRMAQSFLVEWSSGVEYCMWQTLLLVLGVLVLASLVLMVILKWNPIQWFGWICAVASVLVFLNTGVYGLNEYAGPLSEDIQLEETDYVVSELESATDFYRRQAETLSTQVRRNPEDDTVEFDDFKSLAQQAGDGFYRLTYEESLSVFAGSTAPVKELGWADYFTSKGITGTMVGITGEAAVNPQTPAVMLPFAMCREMAHRMSIAIDRDAIFAAYLACMQNADIQFRYSGALMAYYYCLDSLKAIDEATGGDAAEQIRSQNSDLLDWDMQQCEIFLRPDNTDASSLCDLLVNWHIQEVVMPTLREEEVLFNPLDPNQVDISGLPHAPVKEEETNEENAD
ncbi:MAG: DUF3810 family protein [Oscillospiraceae bacterium]|nr:DUF3810 family protein [Oscillospiraceae bacterium]